ncbi:hypothetical protein QTP88_002249 [Uroleucon formosanum]
MSDTDQNETSSSENLIDLESSVSVPSSGELYEPSETIVPIASTRPEGIALIVHSQILQEENVRIGNVVNTVKQGKILAVAINTSEELITIPPLNIEEIEFEEFRETSMSIATNTMK